MSNGVYVTAIAPQSGKILVVLGLAEALSHRVDRLAYFRPVLRPTHGVDQNLHLMTERYRLAVPPEDAYGVTVEEARDLLGRGRHGEMLARILARYKDVEDRASFVVCEGTDFSGVAPSLEMDLNAEIAKDLGIPVMVVLSAHECPAADVVHAAQLARSTFEDADCSLAGLVVNRIGDHRREELDQALDRLDLGGEPVFRIPDVPLLATPTVEDVRQELGAELAWGDVEALYRDVLAVKVAAMRVPNFLEHAKEGTLVITPGDREDVLLAGLLTGRSETYPQIAGILLTGGMAPSESVMRLLRGLPGGTLPVLRVGTDTYETATAVDAIRPTPRPENERRIAAALGHLEAHVDLDELFREIEISRPTVVTPRMFEHGLIEKARQGRQHIVLPEGTDDRILRATEILRLRDVVEITLLGDEDAVRERAGHVGVDLEGVPILDPQTSELRTRFAEEYYERRKHKGVMPDGAWDIVTDVSMFGTLMVLLGLADGMVSGAAHTTQHTIRPALQVIKSPPGVSLVSSVFFMCLPNQVLVFGDCAVNPNPNPEQLADIAISSAATASRFGVEPRIAMLSYSTGVSGQGEDVDKVREATAIAKRRCPDLLLDGPMQYDAAVEPSVARTKMPGSPVAGRATVFVFPDLNTGNNTYKAVQRSAGAVAIGPVLQGLKKPVNDLSRGCLVADIVNTVAITAIQAQGVEA